VTLAGQRLGVEDTWVGRRVIDAVPRVDGGYPVTVPAISAALVTGRLA
jgi:histidinol-phosphate/aromatic aminotransferase/cobyric acid decarboxylase-like protein